MGSCACLVLLHYTVSRDEIGTQGSQSKTLFSAQATSFKIHYSCAQYELDQRYMSNYLYLISSGNVFFLNSDHDAILGL